MKGAMPELDLEEIKTLSAQLSPEDRLQLFTFLAELPDSGLFALKPAPANLEGAQETAQTTVEGDAYVVIATDRMARLLLKDRIVFDVVYYPENFQQSRMEIRSWKDAPLSDAAKEQVIGVLKLYGATEEEIQRVDFDATGKQANLQLFEALNHRITHEVARRLPHMTSLLFDAGIKIIEMGVTNEFADRTGQQKKSLDWMIKELEPYWKHIKAHLGVASGGRRVSKYAWTILERTCLALSYERLKPIWREAKRTARAAQEAREATRRRRWREEVAAIYQDEALPCDLIEQLALPQATAPSDLALLHAASVCLPGSSYSLKTLKSKLREFRPPPPKPSTTPAS